MHCIYKWNSEEKYQKMQYKLENIQIYKWMDDGRPFYIFFNCICISVISENWREIMKVLCMKRGLYSDRTAPPAGLLPFDSLIPPEVGSAGRSATTTLLCRLKTHFQPILEGWSS